MSMNSGLQCGRVLFCGIDINVSVLLIVENKYLALNIRSNVLTYTFNQKVSGQIFR